MFDIVPLPHLLVSIFPRTAPFYKEGTLEGTGPQLSPLFPGGAVSRLNAASLQATRFQYNPRAAISCNGHEYPTPTHPQCSSYGRLCRIGRHQLVHTIYDITRLPMSLEVQWPKLDVRDPAGNSVTLIPRMNPNFAQIRTSDFEGHSSYHSLQMNLTQRLAKGDLPGCLYLGQEHR